MATHDHSEHDSHRGPFSVVHYLEKGDGLAHILVALLLLLLALGILISSTASFVHTISNPSDKFNFAEAALVYLSDLLFGVIVLELLSTILTYIQARNLEATIKDFLVVALISSIRKILLVGAQSSLEKGSAEDFVKEAVGTLVSIVGILLLIGGLLLLDKRMKANAAAAISPETEGSH